MNRIRLFSAFIVLAAAFGCSGPVPILTPEPTATPTPSLPDIINHTKNGVVVIHPTPGRIMNHLGSGFITGTAEDGAILVYTNEHVVGERETVFVQNNAMYRNRIPPIEGTIIWKDAERDLALILACCLEGAVQLELSPISPVQGMTVVALGYPLGNDIEPAASAGIISGVWSGYEPDAVNYRLPVLQTDVAVNPGNSGGPLLAQDGKVIGMVMARVPNTPSGNSLVDVDGYSFAIRRIVLQEALVAYVTNSNQRNE